MSQEQPTPQNQEPTMSDAEMAAREAEAARLLHVDPKEVSRFNLEDMAQLAKDPEEKRAFEGLLAQAKKAREAGRAQQHTMADAATVQRIAREADEARRIALQAKLNEDMPREGSPVHSGPEIKNYLEYAKLQEQHEAGRQEKAQRAAETVLVNPPQAKRPFWKRWFS